MNYRRLGASGLPVSEIGLGSHLTFGTSLGDAESRRCIRRAFDHGINLFDTADGYGDGEAERVLGRVLREFDRSGWILATKCFFPRSDVPTNRGLSRKHIVESVERSLANLEIEHIDLMQCHRPDAHTPVEETVAAMDDLVRQGKILYWGVGRFTAVEIEEVVRTAGWLGLSRPSAHQTRYSLLDRTIEEGILQAGAQAGLGTLAYAPLAQGVLTGKYARGRVPPDSRAGDVAARGNMYDLREETRGCVERLAALAEQAGLPPGRLALAWCLRRPEVTSVIVGATGPEQIEENVAASGVGLEPQWIERVEAILAEYDGRTDPAGQE